MCCTEGMLIHRWWKGKHKERVRERPQSVQRSGGGFWQTGDGREPRGNEGRERSSWWPWRVYEGVCVCVCACCVRWALTASLDKVEPWKFLKSGFEAQQSRAPTERTNREGSSEEGSNCPRVVNVDLCPSGLAGGGGRASSAEVCGERRQRLGGGQPRSPKAPSTYLWEGLSGAHRGISVASVSAPVSWVGFCSLLPFSTLDSRV